MILTNSIKNIFGIDCENFKKMKTIINHNLLQIEKDVENLKDINVFTKAHSLLVLAEAYPLLQNRAKWEEVIYVYMESIRDDIKLNKVYRFSLFTGLADIAFSVYAINKTTGYYDKFMNSLNNYLAEGLKNMLTNFPKDNLDTMHYDIISGVSGIANYMLNFTDNSQSVNEAVHLALDYLNNLCKPIAVENKLIPGWYTKSYPSQYHANGMSENFNYGLSHGIAGILVVLSNAFNKKLHTNMSGIKTILQEFMSTAYLDENGCHYWGGRVYLEEYLSKNINYETNKRMSWCYGSPGILRAIYLGASSIQDEEILNFCEKSMLNLTKLPTEQFELTTPTICHGYAGLLIILKSNILKTYHLIC